MRKGALIAFALASFSTSLKGQAISAPYCPGYAYITISGTSSITGADFPNLVGKGIVVVMNLTSFTGTSITPAIQAKDSVSSTYFQLHTNFTAVTTTGTTVYLLYPGAPAAAGGITATSGLNLPTNKFRITLTYSAVTVSGGTVSFCLLP